VFLDKLKAQNWLDLFANTRRGSSVSDLAEFYANCEVTNGVVTSMVNRKRLRFNAKELGDILGIASKGFGVHVQGDKTVLGSTQLLQLSQQPGLKSPRSVKKREITPLRLLIFWFVIKKYHHPWTRPQSC